MWWRLQQPPLVFGLLLLLGGLCWSLQSNAANFPGEQPTYARETGFESRFYYVASGSDGENQIEYICKAFPGVTASSSTANAVWQVQRFYYNASDQLTRISFAGNDDAYTQICDNRTSLNYD